MDVMGLAASKIWPTKIQYKQKKSTIYYAKGSEGIKDQASNRETIWVHFNCQKKTVLD